MGRVSISFLGVILRKRSGDVDITASPLASPEPTTRPAKGAGQYFLSFSKRSIDEIFEVFFALQQSERLA